MFDLPPPVPGDVLLKPEEVAKMARLSPRTLADRRWKGLDPKFVKLSPHRTGHVRYWRSAVEAWLAGDIAHTAS